jgi:flagellar motor switch protein FliM
LDLQQAWLPLGRFEVKLLNLETNPQFVQLTGPHDIAIQVTFEVRVGQVRGIVSLCLPFALLEPILPKLMTQRSFGASGGAEAGGVSADIEGRLRGTPLSLRAVLGEIRLPIGQLTRLAPGEILPLKGGRDLAVTIEVEGKPRFAGRAGRRHGKRAVEITATLDGGGSQHV